jgi:hypothetical protein
MAGYVVIGAMAFFVGGLSLMFFPTIGGAAGGALVGAGIGWLITRDRSGGGGQAGGAGAEDRPGRASADRGDSDSGGGGEGG